MSREKEEALKKQFSQEYHSEFFCSECYSNPKLTAFDAGSLVAYCEHKRAGFLVRLVDYKPTGPAHIMFPISHPEFLGAVALLSAIAQALQKGQDEQMRRKLAELPEDEMAKS